MSGEPARGYRWRTFEVGETTGEATRFKPGHEASVKHGAYSDRKVNPRADRFVEDLVEYSRVEPTMEHLTRPEMLPAIRAWARAEAAVEMITEYLDSLNDWTGRTKRGSAAWSRLDVVEGRAERLRDRLGLDPQARARLGLTVARTQVAQRSEHQPPDERVQAEIAELEAQIAELEAGQP